MSGQLEQKTTFIPYSKNDISSSYLCTIVSPSAPVAGRLAVGFEND